MEHEPVESQLLLDAPNSSRGAASSATAATPGNTAAADSGLPSSPMDLSQGRPRSSPPAELLHSSSHAGPDPHSDAEIDVEGDDDQASQDWSLEKPSSLKPCSNSDLAEADSDPLSRFMIICDSQNVKWRELVHRHKDHQPPNRCGECQKDFRCRSALMMHYRTHTDERPFQCGICLKSFATKGNLKTHLSVHLESEKLQHLNPGNLSGEAMPPTPNPPAPGPQQQQLEALHSLPALKAGTDDALMDEKESSHQLKWTEHPMPSLPVQQPPQSEPLALTKSSATDCNQISGTVTDSQKVNRPAPATTCEICGKACSCRSALEIHMRTHTKEKPFLCGHCGKGFSTKGNMRQHELTHRRNRLHYHEYQSLESQLAPPPASPQHQAQLPQSHGPNPEDAAKTSTPMGVGALQFQQLSKKDRSRVCEHCNKECPTRSALEIHRRSHTGEKPYRCPNCSKRFSTHGNMQAHVRRHCPQIRAAVSAAAGGSVQTALLSPLSDKAGAPPVFSSHYLIPQAPWANVGHGHQLPPPHLLYSLAAAAALNGAPSLHPAPVSPAFLPSFAFGGPSSSFVPGAVASQFPFQASLLPPSLASTNRS